MNKICLSSDLHFGHKNIVEYTNRGVETTKEDHDTWLINLWNSQLHPSDTLIHLGDFSFYKDVSKTLEILDQLNGNIIMIKGNHDRTNDFFGAIANHRKVKEVAYYKEIKLGGIPTVLFHFSISNWHKQHYGSLHLHGHSHGSFQPTDGKILDVGLDSAYNIFGRHKFFTEEDVLEYMQKRSMHVADHHSVRTGEM